VLDVLVHGHAPVGAGCGCLLNPQCKDRGLCCDKDQCKWRCFDQSCSSKVVVDFAVTQAVSSPVTVPLLKPFWLIDTIVSKRDSWQ